MKNVGWGKRASSRFERKRSQLVVAWATRKTTQQTVLFVILKFFFSHIRRPISAKFRKNMFKLLSDLRGELTYLGWIVAYIRFLSSKGMQSYLVCKFGFSSLTFCDFNYYMTSLSSFGVQKLFNDEDVYITNFITRSFFSWVVRNCVLNFKSNRGSKDFCSGG